MIGTSDARLEIGSVVVNIGAHQWDLLDGAVSFSRPIGLTPYGAFYRDPYGIVARFREVRFVKTEAQLEELRHLAYLAGRSGTRVKFTPDVADLGTFWWVDWPTQNEFERQVENRDVFRVRLAEQSPGV